MKTRSSLALALGVATLALGAGACSSTYTSFLRFGHDDAKLELLEATEDSLDGQREAHEHLMSALNLFNRLTRLDSEDLEELYDDFSDSVDDFAKRTRDWQGDTVDLRLRGDALFAEWSAQLESFSRPDLRERSAIMLEEARERHAHTVTALERTYAKMEPVLTSFRDYVLYFEHNLNPRGIQGLSDKYDGFVDEVLALSRDMDRTRQETEAYLESLEGRVAAEDDQALANQEPRFVRTGSGN